MGCKTKVRGLAWASDFVKPLYLKAGDASPQCSKTFLICKKRKIGPHNSITTSLKIRFTIASLQLKDAVGSLQWHGPMAFRFGVNLLVTSNPLQTLRVSVLHPTHDPQTPPFGLFGLDKIKHGSWV